MGDGDDVTGAATFAGDASLPAAAGEASYLDSIAADCFGGLGDASSLAGVDAWLNSSSVAYRILNMESHTALVSLFISLSSFTF